MFHTISVFSPEETSDMIKLLSDVSSFEDGSSSATGLARKLKQNTELNDAKLQQKIAMLVENRLKENREFQKYSFFKEISKIIVSRYSKEMHYGRHVDAPTMDGKRVDLSFTLFLSPPDEYEGGELIIYDGDKEKKYKLEAGALVMYPTHFLHEVNSVKSGNRICIVGWITSHVRCHVTRYALADVMDCANEVLSKHNDAEMHLKLLKSYANIYRMIASN